MVTKFPNYNEKYYGNMALPNNYMTTNLVTNPHYFILMEKQLC